MTRSTIHQTLIIALLTLLISLQVTTLSLAQSGPTKQVAKGDRCSVCGMFVAKYPAWVTQVVHASGKQEFFDGVKDLMVYYFHPDSYGAKADDPIKEVWLKDYYSLEWLDGRKALFVIGSDVYGPMGQEFIPFSSQEAAEAFLADHQGKDIISFEQISEALVESMRVGNRMK